MAMQSLTRDDPAEIGGYRLSARLGAGGPDEIYRANGTLTLYSASAHYVIQNGLVLISDITKHGSSRLLENGSYNNGGPLTLVTAPYRYSCAGNTLRETRSRAVGPHGSTPGS